MDREAFKQRMQSLKSYREQNPGKGYLDWKASLPDNLQDDSSYNLKRAYELGYEPEYIEEDRSYHLPTRDSETGEILKKPWHPTFLIGLQEDAKLGYYPQTIDGTTYTTTWEGNENPIYKYADGGEVSEEVKNKTEFHRNWYAPRVDLLGKNKKQLGTSLINQLSSDNYLGKKEYNRIINNISKIPEVDRVTANDEQIDRIVKSINQSVDSDNTINKEDALKYHRLLNKATTYNVAERLMDDPEYLIRANQVKKQFGDDYVAVYADIIDKYNNDPFSLPNIESFSEGASRAQLKAFGNDKYSYRIDPNKANLDLPVTEHELSHYADFKRNKDRLDPHGDSNMFYQMSKDLKDRGIDSWDWYYVKPTEQKAHMNQLREYMFQNGMIGTRGQTVDAKMMKKVLDQISKTDSMKEVARASKQFNNINKYTKWFNSIPLLGIGALGVYSNENTDNQ